MPLHKIGKQSIVFPSSPAILSHAAIGGKKEHEGPLGKYFDKVNDDTSFGEKSWEKAESRMQQLALDTAREKIGLSYEDIDVLFAGDLLNQCISSAFAIRDTQIPFLGLYGACSTMAESLLLASCSVDGGYASRAAALTSSHFASAERQYRLPLAYGGQRTPTAQWTVTGSGCCIVGNGDSGIFVRGASIGRIEDAGIKDAANMGAAMAPAAYDTIRTHLQDFHKQPEDYDMIATGDLGSIGTQALIDLLKLDGIDISAVHRDCGLLIFDTKKQDVHAGGSGCGCGASVLCGYLLQKMQKKEIRNLLFCATGALMSPVSSFQGESIPSICHALWLSTERM